VINYAAEHFLDELNIVYVLTVVATEPTGGLAVRGLFAGRGLACFYAAAELARRVNFTMVDDAPRHVVVSLDENEFHSTWLGNKAIYRTRMMIADGGLLTIVAPGVRIFGEDETIDTLIRRYGYRGTQRTLDAVDADPEIADNLSAAAHLIHGSSEGRFTVEYAPGHLSREEIEGVGYQYADLSDTLTRYHIDALMDGWNTLPSGERIYYVSRPALGLWAHRDRFRDDEGD
jgi:hypothetical protein